MWRRKRFAATLTGGWRRIGRALGSNVITTTLCALMGILHAAMERPTLDDTPTAFERQIDNVGEIEKHRLIRGFLRRLAGFHTAYLNTGYDVKVKKAEKAKLVRQAENAEGLYEADLQEYRSHSDKNKMSPKNEKRLQAVMAVLETIVISVAFYALSGDILSLIAMGTLPGLLVVMSSHFNGILLRSIVKVTESQDANTSNQSVSPAKKGVMLGMIVALVVANVLFVLGVSWFRAYATVNTTDLLDRTVWNGPIPSVASFTYFFASISALTFVVGTIASWFAHQPDVIRSYRQLKLSASRHKELQSELKSLNAACARIEKAHQAAYVARMNAPAVLTTEISENLADTIARINIYRNANYTARSDSLDPFRGVEIVHQPINEEPVSDVDLGEPVYSTLSVDERGIDDELDRLLDN